jgi:hypothetical protein
MSSIGSPSEWVDLIDSLVPQILNLLVSSWRKMPLLPNDAREDPTTETFCKLLRRSRDSSGLPFQIQIQMVELEPDAGLDQGRMDIAFIPLIPSESVYFCLECKRLNAGEDARPYYAEYVRSGMLRFVRGQYARAVRNGGMFGYVLNDDIVGAMKGIERLFAANHLELGMPTNASFQVSSVRPGDPFARETRHQRGGAMLPFLLHHLFASATAR